MVTSCRAELRDGVVVHIQKHAETIGEEAIALDLTLASTRRIARIINPLHLSGFHHEIQVVHTNHVTIN